MRELVTIEFQDNSLYTPDQGLDVGGLGISHFWGPVDKIVRVTPSSFGRYFPPTFRSKSYVKAYTALKYGIPVLEVLRVQGTSTYLYIDSEEVQTFLGSSLTIKERAGDYLLLSKYPGYHPAIYEGFMKGKTVTVNINFLEVGVNVDGKSVVIETLVDGVSVEKIEGSPFPQHETDGTQDFITEVMLSKSEFWNFEISETAAVATFNEAEGLADVSMPSTPLNVEFAEFEETSVADADYEAAYNAFFASTDKSQATILMAPTSSKVLNDLVLGIADARSNCIALVGYPTSELFDKDSIETFVETLTATKFGVTAFGRAIENISGRRVIHDGVGPAAGRYALVRKDEGPNQVPSALTFGAYPSVLVNSLSFTEVLALHDASSVNSIYTSANGPQMFGIKTLHPRRNSYYALANVMRVVSLILQSTLVLADGVIHTPNTPSKRASVELDRQSYLDRLIGIENLKSESSVTCNEQNNSDIETEGGRWLIIDFDLWFFKLVERIKIRIKASDTTTQINLS